VRGVVPQCIQNGAIGVGADDEERLANAFQDCTVGWKSRRADACPYRLLGVANEYR
jgi:hypothetical protein